MSGYWFATINGVTDGRNCESYYNSSTGGGYGRGFGSGVATRWRDCIGRTYRLTGRTCRSDAGFVRKGRRGLRLSSTSGANYFFLTTELDSGDRAYPRRSFYA